MYKSEATIITILRNACLCVCTGVVVYLYSILFTGSSLQCGGRTRNPTMPQSSTCAHA